MKEVERSQVLLRLPGELEATGMEEGMVAEGSLDDSAETMVGEKIYEKMEVDWGETTVAQDNAYTA